MKAKLKRMGVIALGIAFLVLGVVGLVLPILQGWLFIAIGLLLLSVYSPTLRERINSLTRDYPKIHYWVLRAEKFVERIVGKPE